MKCNYQGKLFTLDWDDCTLDACLHRCQTILDNYSNVSKLLYRQSPSKSGYHIRGFCISDTNIPHLRFILLDDTRRLLNDIFNRPDNIHDILYDRKTIAGSTSFAGQWKDFIENKYLNILKN